MKKPNKKWEKKQAEEFVTNFKRETFNNPEMVEQFLFCEVQSIIDDTVEKMEELNDRDKSFGWNN